MFLFRKLPTNKVVQTAHACRTLPPLSPPIKSEIHSSSYLCRKKKLHYNRYIKENKIKVYSGFVQDVLDKTQSDYLQNVTSSDAEPDFEKAIMHEAKRRRNAYEHQKAAKRDARTDVDVNHLQKPKKKRKFTHEQMDHIKYLRDENPDLWTIRELSKAFNCSKDEINAILRSKFKPRKSTRDAQDSRANVSSYKPLITSGSSNESGLSLYKKANALLDPVASTTLPPDEKEASHLRNEWFLNYQNSFDHKCNDGDLELFNHSDGDLDHFQDDIHSDEHYQELFEWDVTEEELLSGSTDEGSVSPDEDGQNSMDHNDNENDLSEFKVTTQDNIVFHDDQGRFLYRIP